MKTTNSNRLYIKLLFSIIILFLYAGVSFAQPLLPDRTLTVSATQPLYFGKFYDIGSGGGTVSINWQGIRTTTGGIIAVSSSVARPALFDIQLCQGRNVTITFAPTISLIGSNGGVLTLDVGPTEKGVSGTTFAVENNCNFVTILRVGGTLHIPGNSLPGNYTGSFEISFDQQ